VYACNNTPVTGQTESTNSRQLELVKPQGQQIHKLWNMQVGEYTSLARQDQATVNIYLLWEAIEGPRVCLE